MAQTPRVIEDIRIPPMIQVAGDRSLALNGAGVRSVMLFVVPVKAYVAALHSAVPLRSDSEAMACREPMVFTFTFLRGVGLSQVRQAWLAQIQSSATHTYSGFAKDRDRFVSFFGPIQAKDTHSVEISGEETVVFENGVEKGRIAGRGFQQAFLSLWFGTRPVANDLKRALLSPP